MNSVLKAQLSYLLHHLFRPGEYPAPWGEGFSPLWSLIPRCLRRGSSLHPPHPPLSPDYGGEDKGEGV